MKRVLFSALTIFLCLPALAQQTDVNRYTVFTGFDYLVSPARNLTERGFDVDFGVMVNRWLGLGGDFGAMGSDIFSGRGTITASETSLAPVLTSAAALGAPPPSTVHVPFSSTTYTFAGGPQFYLRKWNRITFFARPGLGGIHENANLTLSPQLVGLLPLLGATVPSSHQSDTTIFFGLGGGFDLNVSRRVGLRFAADWVNAHLFSNLLTNRQNYARFSVGPAFHFGHLLQP